MFTNFGRDIVFSADLCYNDANEKPPSEREGDRVSGGRSLRNFEFSLASLSRPLPQSAALTAPSRREPSFVHSSAYINKVPTNLLIGLWELFVDVFSPLRTTEKATLCFLYGWDELYMDIYQNGMKYTPR